MGQKLQNAPVYFAIGQVRFNQIPGLETYMPRIAERLRVAGYPDIKAEEAVTSFNFTVTAPDAPPQISQSVTKRHTASNFEGTQGFIVEPGALTIQTTAYDVFESFSAALLKGLEIINEEVPGGLAFTDRIGLRYLDAVYPDVQAGQDLKSFLAPEVLGLSLKLAKGQVAHSYSETVANFDQNAVVARTVIQRGKIGFPPDLNPVSLKLGKKFTEIDGLHAVLDMDASQLERAAFNLSELERRFRSLRCSVGDVFEATITPGALEAWR